MNPPFLSAGGGPAQREVDIVLGWPLGQQLVRCRLGRPCSSSSCGSSSESVAVRSTVGGLHSEIGRQQAAETRRHQAVGYLVSMPGVWPDPVDLASGADIHRARCSQTPSVPEFPQTLCQERERERERCLHTCAGAWALGRDGGPPPGGWITGLGAGACGFGRPSGRRDLYAMFLTLNVGLAIGAVILLGPCCSQTQTVPEFTRVCQEAEMFAHLRRSHGAKALHNGGLIFWRVALGLRKVPLGAPLFAQRRMRGAAKMFLQRTRKQAAERSWLCLRTGVGCLRTCEPRDPSPPLSAAAVAGDPTARRDVDIVYIRRPDEAFGGDSIAGRSNRAGPEERTTGIIATGLDAHWPDAAPDAGALAAVPGGAVAGAATGGEPDDEPDASGFSPIASAALATEAALTAAY